jgi:hypothetical protein
MKTLELIKKPIEVVIENNIVEDMIIESGTISALREIVMKKLSSHETEFAEDFLIILVNNLIERKIKAVITWNNLNSLVDVIIGAESQELSISTLDLGNKFPPEFVLEKSEPIEKVVSIFNDEKTKVVVVKSEDGAYLGKVKSSKLKNWFKTMTAS